MHFFNLFRITNIFKARTKSLIFQLWVYFFYIFCCGIRATHARCIKWRRPAAGRSTVFQRGVVLHFYPLKTIPCQGCAVLRPSLPSKAHELHFLFSLEPQEYAHSPFIRKQGNIYKPNNKEMDNDSINEKTLRDVHTKEIDLVNRDPKHLNDDVVKVGHSLNFSAFCNFFSLASHFKCIYN